MWLHFRTVLEGIVAGSGETSVTALPLLAAAEEQQLLVEWNDTSKAAVGRSLIELFELRATQRPDAAAVCFESHGASHRVWSYGELDRRVDQLARSLHRLGVEPEVPVGVLTGHGPELVLGFLGILLLLVALMLVSTPKKASSISNT